MFKPKTTLTKVNDLLKNTLKSLDLEDSFRVYPIWKQWSSIVGEAVAGKTHPDYVTGKTLIVSVESSVWMNELEHQKRSILRRIGEMGLDHPIEEIRFRVKS